MGNNTHSSSLCSSLDISNQFAPCTSGDKISSRPAKIIITITDIIPGRYHDINLPFYRAMKFGPKCPYTVSITHVRVTQHIIPIPTLYYTE